MKGPLRGTSGFRCEDYNQMVSTTGINGPHNQSRVAEILVSGEWGNVVIRKSLSDRFQRDRVKPKGCHTYTDSDQFSSYHKKLINPSFSSHYLPPTYQQVSSSVSKVLHIMLFEDQTHLIWSSNRFFFVDRLSDIRLDAHALIIIPAMMPIPIPIMAIPIIEPFLLFQHIMNPSRN